jgi:succinate dehydrogenase / fumarate reductase cytochrome b subunit
MRYGGMIIFLFIIYHLMHFTFGTLAPLGHGEFEYGHVYANVVAGFSVPAVAGVYIVAMLALGAHLYHGIWSGLYTLGLSHPQYNTARRVIAAGVALTVAIGNCSIPIAVLTGVLKP